MCNPKVSTVDIEVFCKNSAIVLVIMNTNSVVFWFFVCVFFFMDVVV